MHISVKQTEPLLKFNVKEIKPFLILANIKSKIQARISPFLPSKDSKIIPNN